MHLQVLVRKGLTVHPSDLILIRSSFQTHNPQQGTATGACVVSDSTNIPNPLPATMTEPAKEEIKTEEMPSKEELLEVVKERLRFFFSDANLRYDQFLRKLLLEDSQQVTVETLLRFNTIKQHTEDPAIIAQAAKALSDQLVVSDDEKAVGRVKAFSLDQMDDNIPVTLLVKNLPTREEEDDNNRTRIFYDVSGDEIRALFQQYGTIAMVKLRFQRSRHESYDDDDDLYPSKQVNNKRRRIPMGSALVEFESKENLEKAAADVLTSRGGDKLEPKRKLELKDKVLDVLLLDDHVALIRKRKAENEEEKNEADSPKQAKKFEIDWKPGCVIQIHGLSDECDREAILDAVASGVGISLDEVKSRKIYADYSRGQPDGAIRFAEPSDDIKALCDKLGSGELQVKGAKVKTAKILDGEEETKYWNDFIEFKNKQMLQREERSSSRKKRRRS